MPWIKEEKLYLVLVLLLIFSMAVRMPMDSDMWWHLKAGEATLASGNIYRTDTFSSTRTGVSWINHSWLSQVLMAFLLRVGKFTALSIWVGVCAVVSLGLVFLQMDGHPLLRGAVLILAAMVSSVVWSPRPQIMSLVLLALVSWILFSYRNNRKRIYLVGIPLIFALWGNLHAGYVLGLIYLGAFICGELLDKILLRDDKEGLSWKEIGIVALSTLLGFVLVIANPFGLAMWKIPFNTIGIETLQNLINEWASPDFHQAFQQPILWMLLGLVGALGISGKTLRGYRLIPILFFAWAALVARRNFGPFAIVSAPALAEQLSSVLGTWITKARTSFPAIEKIFQSAERSKQDFNPTVRNLLNAALIMLLLAVGVVKTVQVNRPELVSRTEREIYPAGAVEWFKTQEQSFRVFNDYNWGGYLIYHLPEVPVFVDGRTDLYGDEILNDYLAVMQVEDNWEEVLQKYSLNMLLLRKDSCLSRNAILQGWTVVYRDELAVLLRSK